MAGSGVALPIPTTIFGPSRQTPLSVSLTVLPADSASTSITTSTTSRTTTSANITTNTNTTTTTTTTTTTIFPDKRKSAMAAQDTFQNDYYEGRSSSSHSRPQPFPEVIVSAGVPSYHDPRETYTYRAHSRNLENRENDHNFHRVPSPPTITVGSVTVRVEEICLVLVVLMLWAGAITLFINRWGKLRMLEPYQPAYTAPVVPPRPPPPPMGPSINIQSTSDLTMTEGGAFGSRYDLASPEHYGRGSLASGYLGIERSPSCLSVKTLNPQRKVKSAVDLVSLVMQEKMSSNLSFTATNV